MQDTATRLSSASIDDKLELIPTSSITLTERLRTDLTSSSVRDHIDRLKESILRFGGHPHGLLQPILIDHTHANLLQDGFCRYTACCELGWDTIPAYRRATLSEAEYHEIELETNFNRLGFTWQEVVRGVVKIHEARLRAATIRREPWTRAMTGELLGGYSKQYVDNCIRLYPLLESDPRFEQCEGITDAIRLMLRLREDDLIREKAKRLGLVREGTSGTTALPRVNEHGEVVGMPVVELPPGPTKPCVACEGTGKNSKGDMCVPCRGLGMLAETKVQFTPGSELAEMNEMDAKHPGWGLLEALQPAPPPSPTTVIPLSSTLFHGDLRTTLLTFPDACVDHIICDPPYGIDMDNLEQSSTSLIDTSRIAETHNVASNEHLFSTLFPLLDRLLKPGGFIILWCDIMQWHTLYSYALSAGLRVQRWPIVWHKTSTCKNQCAHFNFTKNTELAMVCRKPNATLPRPIQTSVITCPNDADKSSNPFAKPFDVWRFCIESVSTVGQTILDPFAGQGSSILAGCRLNRRMLGVEVDETHYTHMLNNVREYWTGVFGSEQNVRFE